MRVQIGNNFPNSLWQYQRIPVTRTEMTTAFDEASEKSERNFRDN
jgi:hypothetical protein